MIKQDSSRKRKKEIGKYISKANFENEKFQRTDYTIIERVNCNMYLRTLKSLKSIGIPRKDRHVLKKNARKVLDALFWQLDRIHIICTRIEYAQSFGLMTKTSAKHHKNKCLELFDEVMELLLSDHRKFKSEIVNHYQLQVRTLKFKV